MGRVDQDSKQHRRVSHGRRQIMTSNRNYSPTPISLALITALVLFISASFAVQSQSGRQKGPKPSPTPKSDARSRPTARTTATPKPSTTANNNTADDTEDVVRVTSHLVPVPTTVLNARGVAIPNLRLEDFELTVDGQLKPISEITR